VSSGTRPAVPFFLSKKVRSGGRAQDAARRSILHINAANSCHHAKLEYRDLWSARAGLVREVARCFYRAVTGAQLPAIASGGHVRPGADVEAPALPDWIARAMLIALAGLGLTCKKHRSFLRLGVV
jgi:hypothetical protein